MSLKKIFILLLVLFSLLLSESGKRLITVGSSDYVEILPDTAYINLAVSLEKESPELAAEIGEELRKNILAVYQLNNIDKENILLDSSTISEKYNYQEKTTTPLFIYQSKVKIKDFSKLNKLKQELINKKTFSPVKDIWFSKKGLQVNYNVSYELDSNLGATEKEALQKAYKKALGKIEALAQVNGLKYKIHNIKELSTSARGSGLMLQKASFNALAESAADNIDEQIPTLQKVYAEIEVSAEII